MAVTQRLCRDVEHVFGANPAGEWTETYTDINTGAILLTQPIAPHKPTQTAPAQVGLENGWCVMEEPQSSSDLPTPESPEPGMGSFFLLVIVITGAIAAFQHFSRQSAPEPYEPQFLPNPWHHIPSPPDPPAYGHLVRTYPISQRFSETGTPANLQASAIEAAPAAFPETQSTRDQPPPNHPPTTAPTTPQPGTNHPPTKDQPPPNQGPTGTPTFDPREPEQPGEFEFYQALLRVNNWSATGKDILKTLWKAQPNTARYQPGLKRRNQFANRLNEYTPHDPS